MQNLQLWKRTCSFGGGKLNSLRFVALGIAIALAIVFGWRLAGSPDPRLWVLAPPKPDITGAPTPVAMQPVTQAPAGADLPASAGLPQATVPQASLQQVRDAILAHVAEEPEYAAYFQRLQAAFPVQYTNILDRLASDDAAAVNAGRPSPSLDLQILEVARSLQHSHGILAARADAALLQAIIDSQSAMIQALAPASPKLCVDFFYGGAGQGFFDFLVAHRALAAHLYLAWLEATSNGKAHPLTRPEPDEADIQMLDDALAAKGLGRSAIDALLDSKLPDPPLSDADMCQAARDYFAALRALPDEPQLRLLARSLALAARS